MIVVNHALLMADAATENRVLPEYHHLVIESAHHLKDAVTDQLSLKADGFILAHLQRALPAGWPVRAPYRRCPTGRGTAGRPREAHICADGGSERHGQPGLLAGDSTAVRAKTNDACSTPSGGTHPAPGRRGDGPFPTGAVLGSRERRRPRAGAQDGQQ